MRLAQPFPSTEACIRTADNDGPATTNGDHNHPGTGAPDPPFCSPVSQRWSVAAAVQIMAF